MVCRKRISYGIDFSRKKYLSESKFVEYVCNIIILHELY